MELIAIGTRLQGCAGMVMCHCKLICIFCLKFPYPAFQRLEAMHLLVAQQRGLVFFFFTNVFFINGAFFHENKMKLLQLDWRMSCFCIQWHLDAPETIGAPIQVENVLLGADGQWKCHGNLRLGVEIWCKHLSCDQKENATDSEMLGKRITGWWFQIFFSFHPYLGKIPILTNIFQRG